ncbi:hypothetical protein Prubr_01660 [Polymorphospora rubra]|uniref:Uncharacterized protein n=2 Tax=Polymorphospora rubra TaxID=338584 RepID=A0A810MUP1_9ACTN|nr:hypothetical protein Prubr_01660 [Polymorphospora rubra]
MPGTGGLPGRAEGPEPMKNNARHSRPSFLSSSTARTAPLRIVTRIDAGLAVLTAAPAATPANQPVTNATWAFSVRRFVRLAVWATPAYALLYGLVTVGSLDGGPAPYLEHGSALHLLGWVAAVWLGLVALVALAGVQVSARTRRTAAAGLMIGIAGAALMLPFATLPADTAVYGLDAGAVTLAGATVFSIGWLVMGWAVRQSGLFNRSDGVLLMLAAPMLGVAGLLIGPLQTVGALLALAGGIGVAVGTGRLMPSAARSASTEPVAEVGTATIADVLAGPEPASGAVASGVAGPDPAVSGVAGSGAAASGPAVAGSARVPAASAVAAGAVAAGASAVAARVATHGSLAAP